MFYVFGPLGPTYQGTHERLRQISPVRGADRPQQLRGKRLGIDEPPREDGSALQRTVGALKSYTRTQQVAAPPRRVLQCVRDVMTRGAVTVQPEQSVREAWKLLADQGIAQAPVTDSLGRVIGLFMRADVSPERLLLAPDATAEATLRAYQPVEQVMFQPVPTVSPDAGLRELAQALLDTGLPGLPVTEADGALLGFVSRTDILRALVAEPPLDLWS